MSTPFPFPDQLNLLDREIRTALAGYTAPGSLYDPIRYILKNSGKRIRPLLVLLTGESLGGDRQLLLKGAMAVELLHNFTLVHDDIMDQDDLRRGQTTIHKRWDEGTAILSGDGLIGLAYRLLTENDYPNFQPVLKTFTDAVVEVCEGQALDKEFETSATVSLEDYRNMIAKKTAALIEMAVELGALMAGAERQVATGLAEFGYNIGMAFQIQDDLLDFLSTNKILGKPVGSDLLAGKKTYVTLMAQQLFNEQQLAEFEQYLLIKALDDKMLHRLQQLLHKGGIVAQGEKEVHAFFLKAEKILRQVFPTSDGEQLTVATNWILNRTY
ncbi:MAG: polyprenyl synthetase family protein [Candidatus Delongbacteria bacterium]|nr:polyprenyl synthetase family protein [Candidatus Delongbacteria bacterium]